MPLEPRDLVAVRGLGLVEELREIGLLRLNIFVMSNESGTWQEEGNRTHTHPLIYINMNTPTHLALCRLPLQLPALPLPLRQSPLKVLHPPLQVGDLLFLHPAELFFGEARVGEGHVAVDLQGLWFVVGFWLLEDKRSIYIHT